MFSQDDLKDIISSSTATDSKREASLQVFDPEESLVIAKPQDLHDLIGIKSADDVLALGSSELIPNELQGLKDLIDSNRPNMLRHRQPYRDGVLIFALPQDTEHNQMGWFLWNKDGSHTFITSMPELYEGYAPEFYGGVVPESPYSAAFKDEQMLSVNDGMIREVASRYMQSLAPTLEQSWSVNTVIPIRYSNDGTPTHLRFIQIKDDGSISSLNLDGAYVKNVKIKDVDPVVTSWCRTNGVMFDTYKSELLIDGQSLPEKAIAAKGFKVASDLQINLVPQYFKDVVIGYGLKNPYNSLTARMIELEDKGKLGLVKPYDHKHLASTFLKVVGDEDYVKMADASLQYMVEQMVIRALFPGFSCRSCVILSGPQGCGKSGFFKTLGGDNDVMEMQAVSEGDGSKGGIAHTDTQKKLSQSNLLVINEIGRAFRKINDDDMKDFITGEECSFVEKYEKGITKKGRTSVIVGTTNTPYILKDTTGNTRYQIIEVGVTMDNPVDWNALTNARQGILLSALQEVRRIGAGGISALKSHMLPDWAQKISDERNALFLEGNDYVSLLAPLLRKTVGDTEVQRTTVSMNEIKNYLELSSEGLNKVRNDIAAAMLILQFRQHNKRIQFNGFPTQTVFVRTDVERPANREEPLETHYDPGDY